MFRLHSRRTRRRRDAGLPPRRGIDDNAAAGSAEAARPPLRLAGRSRRAMAEAVSAGRRHRLHPRAEGRGRRSRKPRTGSIRCSAASARSRCGSRRRAKEIRRAQRLRYKVFYEEMSAVPNARLAVVAARPRRVRRDLRPPARARPRRRAVSRSASRSRRSSAPIACCARRWRTGISASTRAGEYDVAPLVDGLSGPALPRARPLLRAAGLSQPAHGRAALARHLDLCPAPPHRRDDRLRQPRGHRPAQARPAAELPASLRRARREPWRVRALDGALRRDGPHAPGGGRPEGGAARRCRR